MVSMEEDQAQEIAHVKKVLTMSGYRPWIYDTITPKTEKAQEKVQGEEGHEGRTRSPQVGLPYVKNLSEKLQRIYRKHGVGVFHKPTNTLRSMLVRPKHKTAPMNKCGVIYKLNCDSCKKEYIGETGRAIGTRLKEHQKPQSAIGEHVENTGHKIDWDSAKVIDQEAALIPRKIREAIHIYRDRPQLNRDQGWDLPPTYNHLLSRGIRPYTRTQLITDN
jgi:hypothetical protein